jgi:membrane-bound serine protease (ClpP class)
MEVILFLVLLIVMIVFFGMRRILFGDHPLLKNKKGIRELLTGTVQKSMLDSMLDRQSGLTGKIGEVYTVLKPSGKILIEDEQYEATTSGEYIDKGEKVKVIGKGLSNVLRVRKAKSKELNKLSESPSSDN